MRGFTVVDVDLYDLYFSNAFLIMGHPLLPAMCFTSDFPALKHKKLFPALEQLATLCQSCPHLRQQGMSHD